MSGQTRRRSALETVANTAAGLGVAVAANLWLLPWWGFQPSLGDSFEIGAVFTAVSLGRGYILRRLFNAWDRRSPKPCSSSSTVS
jgi:hypothetical protein